MREFKLQNAAKELRRVSLTKSLNSLIKELKKEKHLLVSEERRSRDENIDLDLISDDDLFLQE